VLWNLPIMERKMWVEQAQEMFRRENDTKSTTSFDESQTMLDSTPQIRR